MERAQELRALLREAIDHLKPTPNSAFQSSTAWPHHNALHFAAQQLYKLHRQSLDK